MSDRGFGGGFEESKKIAEKGFDKMVSSIQRPGRTLRTEQRPLSERRFTIHAQGPRHLRLFAPINRVGNGPGEPPPGFVTATTSKDEWYIYWALARIFDDPRNPFAPPWYGARSGVWDYQSPFTVGPVGGATIDFVVHLGKEDVALRVQTERWHVFAGPNVHSYDFQQLLSLSARFRVEDIYSQDFIQDSSGQAAIIEVKRLLAGGEENNPVTAGTAMKTRFDTY